MFFYNYLKIIINNFIINIKTFFNKFFFNDVYIIELKLELHQLFVEVVEHHH